MRAKTVWQIQTLSP